MNENGSPFTSGEPLLLLPGLMCDSRIFARQLAAFPSARVAPDYGDLDSLPAMAARVLAAAPDRFALLGHSMGGRVALELVRQAPERVARLALVSTGIHGRRDGEAEKRYALRDLGRERGMAALVEAWLPPMLGQAATEDQVLVQALGAMCRDAGLDRYEAQTAALLNRPEVESLLPNIACPTLVAVGTEDRWSPPAQHQSISALIPGAELILIEQAGHMLPAEAPDALNAATARWLATPAEPLSDFQGEHDD